MTIAVSRATKPDTADILVVEPRSDGHVGEWIEELVRYVRSGNTKLSVRFAVSSHVVRSARAYCSTEEISRYFIAVPLFSTFDSRVRGKFGEARQTFRIAKELARRHGVRHLHFLYLDNLFLTVAHAAMFRNRITMSGVLFRPCTHYRTEGGSYRRRLRERVRAHIKRALYRICFKSSCLSLVLSLDPFFAEQATGYQRRGCRVAHLCEPSAPIAEALGNPATDPLFEKDPDRKLFLLFGAIDRRKGVNQTLAGLEALSDRALQGVSLLLAGRIREDERTSIMAAIDQVRGSRRGASVLVIDRFLERRELARLVLDSDVVLAPYQRAVGTSGVLTWAAFANKPLLGQDYGAIGELIRRYRLGWPVDTTRPAAIGDKIAELSARLGCPEMDCDGYRSLCAPWRFADTTFSEIGNLIRPARPVARLELVQ